MRWTSQAVLAENIPPDDPNASRVPPNDDWKLSSLTDFSWPKLNWQEILATHSWHNRLKDSIMLYAPKRPLTIFLNSRWRVLFVFSLDPEVKKSHVSHFSKFDFVSGIHLSSVLQSRQLGFVVCSPFQFENKWWKFYRHY